MLKRPEVFRNVADGFMQIIAPPLMARTKSSEDRTAAVVSIAAHPDSIKCIVSFDMNRQLLKLALV